MAWIDSDAVITALDSGHLPASGGEQRIVRIAASLTACHPVSLRDAIPGLDQRTLGWAPPPSAMPPGLRGVLSPDRRGRAYSQLCDRRRATT